MQIANQLVFKTEERKKHVHCSRCPQYLAHKYQEDERKKKRMNGRKQKGKQKGKELHRNTVRGQPLLREIHRQAQHSTAQHKQMYKSCGANGSLEGCDFLSARILSTKSSHQPRGPHTCTQIVQTIQPTINTNIYPALKTQSDGRYYDLSNIPFTFNSMLLFILLSI